MMDLSDRNELSSHVRRSPKLEQQLPGTKVERI